MAQVPKAKTLCGTEHEWGLPVQLTVWVRLRWRILGLRTQWTAAVSADGSRTWRRFTGCSCAWKSWRDNRRKARQQSEACQPGGRKKQAAVCSAERKRRDAEKTPWSAFIRSHDQLKYSIYFNNSLLCDCFFLQSYFFLFYYFYFSAQWKCDSLQILVHLKRIKLYLKMSEFLMRFCYFLDDVVWVLFQGAKIKTYKIQISFSQRLPDFV